jgi:hypothetical protein
VQEVDAKREELKKQMVEFNRKLRESSLEARGGGSQQSKTLSKE